MGKRRQTRGRKGPTDPMAILLQKAKERGAKLAKERAERGDPSRWGISAELEMLPTAANDVTVVHDRYRAGRIAHARRSDVFSILYDAGGLSIPEHQAARRYFQCWAERAGARLGEDLGAPIDAAGDAELGEFRGIMAGKAIEGVHARLSRGDARLLQAVTEPAAFRGEVRVWRELVREVTGETERHAQAARVRAACANLVEAWADWDAEQARLARQSPRTLYGGSAS